MTKLRGETRRFDRTGLLAVDPKAFFELFLVADDRSTKRFGSVDVIEVSGPLVQRDEMWCESYEALRARFKASIAGDAQAIVLRFDSPGGDASGCFETARAMRAEALAARKPLYAYVDRSCSAAYALASAATHGVVIGETCCAGSIGVLSSRADVTAMNTARGIRMAFVTSGARKLDGNPDVPITEAELVETQRHVDDLAVKFFGLLGDMRPAQLSAAAVAGFDGGVFYGEAAVAAGLADAVGTFDELIELATKGQAMTLMQAKSDYDSARASLEKVAKGKDANAAAAKRALAALAESAPAEEDEPAEEPKPDAEEPEEEPAAAEPEEDEPAAAGDAAPSAAASDADEPADGKPKPKGEQAATESAQLTLAAKVHRLEARLEARDVAAERKRLIASRPDFGPEMRAALAKEPIETVRRFVKNLERKPSAGGRGKQAITTVGAARGDSQIDADAVGRATARSSDAAELDRAMGFVPQKLGCRREGATLYFGVMDADKKSEAGAA
jgi:capsid assembly protease